MNDEPEIPIRWVGVSGRYDVTMSQEEFHRVIESVWHRAHCMGQARNAEFIADGIRQIADRIPGSTTASNLLVVAGIAARLAEDLRAEWAELESAEILDDSVLNDTLRRLTQD
jgi:hypothetical protein